MNKRITNVGKKALDARKYLDEKERVSKEEMIQNFGEDVYTRGKDLLWTSVNKNGKETLKRDPITEHK
ncbi:hypothetical protein [Candidatus Nitrosotalea okcheonensis]|uniref:Uncharacterized protein n=1 Tax=Candidatus Nitrosotalea okcheonensis TaxID=1903276 RepID=A0A2H1FC52_9ARCH|nr:hypothetical protein [Candidatus Nitrosotalea okcheonensis]SMH70342.1 protein of unknown function [Candidatus Nitrosotalea okcheonensis]